MNNTTNQEPTLGSKENPIFVENINDFYQVKSDRYFYYYCKSCGKETHRKRCRGKRRAASLERLLCNNCSHAITNMARYGVKNPFQSEFFKEESKNTCKSKYGTEYASQSTTFREKVKQTCLEKYGETTNLKCTDTKEKIEKTLQERYGVSNARFLYKQYKYDNLSFDSSWELAFYIYHKDNGINIIRNKDLYFEYVYKEKTLKYYPDFIIGNKIFEIKGNQFFNKNGQMINIFDRSNDEQYLLKQKCAIENNVIFIDKIGIKKYIQYITNKYGYKYLRNFKVQEVTC